MVFFQQHEFHEVARSSTEVSLAISMAMHHPSVFMFLWAISNWIPRGYSKRQVKLNNSDTIAPSDAVSLPGNLQTYLPYLRA